MYWDTVTVSRAASWPCRKSGAVKRPTTGVPLKPTWSLPEPAQGIRSPLPEAAIDAVRAARESLAGALERIKENYPPVGRLCLTGHAHIDLAWLWPLAETRRKTRRTFSTVLDLMDRYPDFTFNQSSAQAYAWIEEDDPAVFERIKERVAEGRWEPIGGMWVESDANVTGGEAFVRQVLYGQKYFESTFGKRHTVVWLPDVFGYSGGMPQLMRGAGLTGFFTTKLNWNEANSFPFDLFTWEGVDGTQVVAHTFFNPNEGYNGNILPLDTKGTWDRYRGKTRHFESLFAFGWGDGAGGPTEKMLENYARIKDFPALPKLRMGNVQQYFASLPKAGLPTAVGELYLELHRGTLTTQAKVKELNRASEQRLFEAEVFSSLASIEGYDYPAAQIETAWKTLLLNQFHDILPGSSINEVYVDTHRQLEEVVETATCFRDLVLGLGQAPQHGIQRLVVANASINPRPLKVLIPAVVGEESVKDISAEHGVTQIVDEGTLVTIPGAEVPGLSSMVLSSAMPAPESPRPWRHQRRSPADEGFVLENQLLRVTIGPDGSIHSCTISKQTATRCQIGVINSGRMLTSPIAGMRGTSTKPMPAKAKRSPTCLSIGIRRIRAHSSLCAGRAPMARIVHHAGLSTLVRFETPGHRHRHRLARAAGASQDPSTAGGPFPPGGIRNHVWRGLSPHPSKRALGRRAFRGMRSPLGGHFRAGVWCRTAEHE